MSKSFKLGVSSLFLASAFAWHQDRSSHQSEVQNSKIVLNTALESPKPKIEAKIKLPENVSKKLNSKNEGIGELHKNEKVRSSLSKQCPEKKYYDIMAFYKKGDWTTCLDLKTRFLLQDGKGNYYRSEIERISNPLLEASAQHRFQVSLVQVLSPTDDRGTTIFSDIVTLDFQNLYIDKLKEFAPIEYFESLSEVWVDKSDYDQLCFNNETREYTRTMHGNLSGSDRKFLSRTVLNVGNSKRVTILCQSASDCTCSTQTIKMKQNR